MLDWVVTLYEQFLAAGIPTEYYKSDLWVPDTPENRGILVRNGRHPEAMVTIEGLDKNQWLEVPFGNDEYFTGKPKTTEWGQYIRFLEKSNRVIG